MNILNSVRGKLISAFLLVAILISVIGIVGVKSLANVNKNAETMYNINMQSISINLSIKANISEIKSQLLIMMYERDKNKVLELEKNIENKINEDNEYIEIYEGTLTNQEERNALKELKNKVSVYKDIGSSIVDNIKYESFDGAQKQYKQVLSLEKEIMRSIDDLIEMNEEDARITKKDIAKKSEQSYEIMIILTSIGFISSILLGVILSMQINEALIMIKEYAERFASYDFSTPMIITRKDEFGQIGAALNKAQENVKKLINKIMKNVKV